MAGSGEVRVEPAITRGVLREIPERAAGPTAIDHPLAERKTPRYGGRLTTIGVRSAEGAEELSVSD